MYLAQVGRLDEAMVAIHRAQALDPLSLIINTEVGRLLFFMRQYDAAIAQFSRTLEMDPNFALAHLHLGSVLVEKRMYSEAIAEFQKAGSLGGAAPAASLGWAYARAGRKREAEEVLRRVIRESEHTFTPPAAMATLYTGLGDNERAIAWLDKGVSQGGPLFLKVDPRWDSLRSDPEFQRLTKRIGVGP
jgi:tetratricopeptide (TPR) repeat protein